jgi:CDP-glucose 4,6-dehydratase
MRLPDPAFWQGRRVYVTGHSGFKGSWLTFWLARLGAEVTGFSLQPETEQSAFSAMGIAARSRSQFGDIRDGAAVSASLSAARPEIVFHLAAQPLVLRGYREPVATFDTNVMGTVNVLEAVRGSSDVRAVVVVTTDKVYAENLTGAAYREDDVLGGHDPYAASKACAELATAAYRASFLRDSGTAAATVRAGNVIGGGDWSLERLIPDVVRAILAGEPLVLRQPSATRPWQHVLEPLAGYLIVAEDLSDVGTASVAARAWNIGPDPEDVATVADVVERFQGVWAEVSTSLYRVDAFHEASQLTVDAGAARALLGWSQRLSLDDAIAMTASWYRDVARGADASEITARQIEEYTGQPPSHGSLAEQRTRRIHAAGI